MNRLIALVTAGCSCSLRWFSRPPLVRPTRTHIQTLPPVLIKCVWVQIHVNNHALTNVHEGHVYMHRQQPDMCNVMINVSCVTQITQCCLPYTRKLERHMTVEMLDRSLLVVVQKHTWTGRGCDTREVQVTHLVCGPA